MTSLVSLQRVLIAVCLVLIAAGHASTQSQTPAGAPNELDAFMEKVLARREVNQQTLKQYILDEEEEFEVLGPGRWPLHRSKREFTWYMRDGIHVRSPLKFNGVTVNQEARDRYERNWLERERRRQKEQAEKRKEKEKAGRKESDSSISIGPGGVEVGAPGVPAEPRFVSEAYFMDFKFEPGNYYLAGREQLEGKDVLKIEYYPTHMFDDDDEKDESKEDSNKPTKDDQQKKKEKEFEQQIERRMNKTALITLWVDPSEHQIVKYTFDNVWMDFLPAAWLVRVDDIRASMTMGQPFPGIWLPRGMNIHAGVTLANGSFEAGYTRAFSHYREADVKSRIRVPKVVFRVPQVSEPASSVTSQTLEPAGSGPWVDDNTQSETIREIRVHGNAFLADEDVIKLAGVSLGVPLQPADLDAIRERLKDSGRFDSVEVRKRYRSLSDSTDVALVFLVHERPGVRNIDDGPSVVFNPIRRVKSRLMFLPILTYADGYGFTYGGRVSTVGLLGFGERLSVPLTWGGVRRAALEFERPFERGPLTRVESSVAIWNRENPRFNIRDQRFEVKGRAERVFADLIRVGVDASRSTISFAEVDDRLTAIGANVALDTRGNPAYPSNAVYVSTGWTGLNFRLLPDRVNRYSSEARGYLRVYRQNVVAARVQYVTADTTLPPYERLLLGGSSTVRGFRTGAFDGDRALVTSAELRVPITSVLSGAKLGVTAFVDAGQIWNAGESRDQAVWHRGVGGGLFLIASIVRINLDVAHGLKTGDTRVHLSSGFTF
ncbi:MAG: FtsQ-type POTRA domain-containing protein [Vicinamibacterales bacterium]